MPAYSAPTTRYSLDPSPDFAYPKHDGSAADDVKPLGHRERHGAEYLSSEFDDDDLPDQDDSSDTNHSQCMTGILEYRMVGSEYAGIEQVPELQHHEDGEEGSQCGWHFGRWQSLDVNDEAHQDSKEASGYS